MFLTIFTPTYNRAYTLKRLYNALCMQTSYDFEWIVIDDGSTDETGVFFEQWIKENRIELRYTYKENGGKASAYNMAVEQARGNLFVCVDSDDYLVNNAVETVISHWKRDSIMEYKGQHIIGQIYFRVNNEGIPFTQYSGNEMYSTLLGFYRQYGLSGDTMLVYDINIVKKYKFSVFKGEKFVPESMIYDQYDGEGILHIYKNGLYIGEYLPDGYTASIKRLNAMNPNGYRAFILQRIKIENKTRHHDKKAIVLDIIRLISIDIVLGKSAYKDLEGQGIWRCIAVFLWPLGKIRYIRDFGQYIRKE